MTTSTNNPPVFSRKSGSVEIAVWKRQSNDRTFYNVSVKPSFKKGDDWESTQASVNRLDVLPAAKLLEWAYETVMTKKNAETGRVAAKRYDGIEVEVHNKEGGTESAVRLLRWYEENGNWKNVSVWFQHHQLLPAAHLFRQSFDAIDELFGQATSPNAQTFSGELVAADEDIPF